MPDAARNILLFLLSLIAGCVDAVAFVHTGAFPANMTGNSVVLAVTLLGVGPGGALLAGAALLGFCCGAALGSRLTLAPGRDHAWSPRTSLTLLLAGLLLLGCAASVALSGPAALPLLITLTAAAMGMQSAAVLRLGVSGVATVVVTGTLTTAIMRLAGSAPAAGKDGPWLPSLSWLAYFLGALLGALPSLLHAAWILAVPGLLLAGVALAGFRFKGA
jgi:uncharacterized membrane protein YoaK (UPF0700 family)